MNYPLISEYIESIMCAEDNFATLTNLRPVLDNDGRPIMSSGNFAVVFKMTDGKKDYAIKCFTREQEGRENAYKQITEELKKVSSSFLCPTKYFEKELYVDSNNCSEMEFPVLQMDWVAGDTLFNYIRSFINDRKALCSLLKEFKRLFIWLIDQPFAHGDLKPDNILVTNTGEIVLVDYDGMYVPSMRGKQAREVGSPDFRNPNINTEMFDEQIDVFSLVSIYVSLSLIAHNVGTLSRFGSSERLLFSENDYLKIDDSQIYQYIVNTFSLRGRVRCLTDVLKKLCDGHIVDSSILSEIKRALRNDAECTLGNNSTLPNAESYITSFSNSGFYLKNLKQLEPVVSNNNIVYVKGANSVVFKMHNKQDKKYYALKCYTNISYSIFDRIQLIIKKMEHIESPYIVKMQLLLNELNINCLNDAIGEGNYFFPVVLMEWVDGDILKNYVANHQLTKDDFKKTLYSFSAMASWLLDEDFSHGDISSQNIIVTPEHNIKIVDYDNIIFNTDSKENQS